MAPFPFVEAGILCGFFNRVGSPSDTPPTKLRWDVGRANRPRSGDFSSNLCIGSYAKETTVLGGRFISGCGMPSHLDRPCVANGASISGSDGICPPRSTMRTGTWSAPAPSPAPYQRLHEPHHLQALLGAVDVVCAQLRLPAHEGGSARKRVASMILDLAMTGETDELPRYSPISPSAPVSSR